ncbi:hypothetical protein KY290_005029 [Solanum tuberosum]|uniref:Uncharacterized protein n=1 Tax=Solanum tuberosum TaxID=4113 RepID=A0ABQ7WCY2_SOLTU|nr:hypothetical protein KY289_005396 [Solanum tuberosum]KAH0778602.1 hypothetical protein KY290_005029 [Solanum tuberosum]
MVDNHVEGEVDPSYLHWFFDQAPFKVMPEGSARELRDQEEEIEVRIKQARLEVERNYRSTLYILSNDLKNAREELAQRDAIFKERALWSNKRGNIAKRFTSYQAEVAIKRNQWMGERDELHNQIEEFQAHEEDLTHTVGTTQRMVAELSREYGGGQMTSASTDRELD